MKFASDVWILWFLNNALQAGLVVQLFRTGLRSSFPRFQLYFTLSLFVTLVQLLLPYLFPKNRNLYGWIFILWTYLSSFFEFLLIRELSTNALAPFPAIKAASVRTLNVFWAILIAVGASWYFYLHSLPAQKSPLLYAAYRYHDAVSLGFTLYILLFLSFVAWMPVPLSRNLLSHTFLMASYFLTLSLAWFVVQLGSISAQSSIASYISLGGTSLVFLAWMLTIKPGKDETLNTPKGQLNQEEATQMLARLDELNSTLSRSGPKVLR